MKKHGKDNPTFRRKQIAEGQELAPLSSSYPENSVSGQPLLAGHAIPATNPIPGLVCMLDSEIDHLKYALTQIKKHKKAIRKSHFQLQRKLQKQGEKLYALGMRVGLATEGGS